MVVIFKSSTGESFSCGSNYSRERKFREDNEAFKVVCSFRTLASTRTGGSPLEGPRGEVGVCEVLLTLSRYARASEYSSAPIGDRSGSTATSTSRRICNVGTCGGFTL